MATLIPSLASCLGRMTSGEKRLARRLEAKLEDDYLCWYEVAVGPQRLHPDFLILHPRRGLLVLEVKDWKLDTIQRANRTEFTLLVRNSPTNVPNPLLQARQYAHAVVSLLEQDPCLLQPEGGRYQGKLCFPYGYGVVLSNITRKQFEATDLGEVLEAHYVICQDEMLESVDAELFQKRLWEMFSVRFDSILSLPQIDRIRWHLFPDVRINASQLSLWAQAESDTSWDEQDAGVERATMEAVVPDLLRVMDIQQEQLARSLGEGHRVIHGVSGSGKTLVLGYRCLYLAKAMHLPILVLCFNVALASKLQWLIEEKGLGSQVRVRHFHRWCAEQLELYHVPKPEFGQGYLNRLVEQVIAGLERGQIPAGQYGAVMIDEGHDFRAEWFKLVAKMVNPETNSLLVLYDDAQSIYSRRSSRRKFSFSSVGVQARGRTTILRLNYRNTAEILGVAYEFAKELLTAEQAEEDGVPLVEPETAGRHGAVPELVSQPAFSLEVQYLTKRMQALHDEGTEWNDMAVIYRSHFMGEVITSQFRSAGIPVEWLNEEPSKRYYKPQAASIKVMTMHSSKGLEFPVVVIPGLGYMPHSKAEPLSEARLLYVAMTRAMDTLILTHHQESEFVQRLGEARASLA